MIKEYKKCLELTKRNEKPEFLPYLNFIDDENFFKG